MVTFDWNILINLVSLKLRDYSSSGVISANHDPELSQSDPVSETRGQLTRSSSADRNDGLYSVYSSLNNT